jgi:hypothetical protein
MAYFKTLPLSPSHWEDGLEETCVRLNLIYVQRSAFPVTVCTGFQNVIKSNLKNYRVRFET